MDLTNFLACIREYHIPLESPDGLSFNGYGQLSYNHLEYWKARDECIKRGMWAIISRDFAKLLADWIGSRMVLEIMAGAGWLAKALQDEGIHVTPTDNGEWDERHSQMVFLTQVKKFDAIKAVNTYRTADILLVSWPPYGDEAIVEACQAWGTGRPIIYIGESDGGCNAPDNFFAHFRQLDPSPDIDIVSWDGLHDHVFFGKWVTN